MGPLEEMASRQGVWSATADKLKRNVVRVRGATLVLSMLGALAAAIASQVGEEALRLALGLASTVVLAAVSFLSLRLMGSDKVSAWVRARAASEALKREAFRFAVAAAPYHDPTQRIPRLNEEREKIERDVDDLLGQTIMAKPGRTPVAPMSADEYIQSRVQGQVQDFYEPRAERYRQAAARLRWAEFTFSLAAAMMSGIVAVAGKNPAGVAFDFIALTAVLTTIAGAVLAHIEASRYDYNVTTYRAAARRLRNEIASMTEVPVVPSPPWSAFVDRCEAIIAAENNNWIAKWTKPEGR